ncbi:hypothetical protein P8452_52649 [Trifolium repens]|nr:hypothetical protein P8452_52649 [Trifolium repens]
MECSIADGRRIERCLSVVISLCRSSPWNKAATLMRIVQVTLILRGANDYMLDEMDRALHDALSIVKRTLASNTVVAGGGAVESALSV